MAALPYTGGAQLLFDTADHPPHFAHVLWAVGVVCTVGLGVDRELSAQRHALLCRQHLCLQAFHVSHFPRVNRTVARLQYFAYRIECMRYILRCNAEVDLVSGKLPLAVRLQAIHMDEDLRPRHLEMIGGSPATVIFTQRALCDVISGGTMVNGETCRCIGTHFALIQTAQLRTCILLQVRWAIAVLSFKLKAGLLIGIAFIPATYRS